VGRLFRKIFAFVWLAQLAGMLAIAGTFWFNQPRTGAYPPPPPALAWHDPTGDPGAPGIPGAHRPPPRPHDMLIPGLPLRPMLATLLASLCTAALLAWYLAKPIEALRSAFDAVARGDLNRRVGPALHGRNDELADLGHEFDRMTARLQATMGALRNLLHDVSHEVRSPLARLQAATGLLRQRNASPDPLIERIETETGRIDALIGELLKLSRLEAGEFVEAEQSIDMGELINGIVDDANFESATNGPKVVLMDQANGRSIGHPGAGPQVRGRLELLHGALENIVRNALKHAPTSREIFIATRTEPASCRYLLQVLDSGPGVEPGELKDLFTPFFRARTGRTRDGYGLGLAIAKRSIEAHGGSIQARNRAEGGLLVEIQLPIATG
jgi:two-component system OmpR family sensor kinase